LRATATSRSCRSVLHRGLTRRSALARDRHLSTLPQASCLEVTTAGALRAARSPRLDLAAGVLRAGLLCRRKRQQHNPALKSPAARSRRGGRAQARSYRRSSGAKRFLDCDHDKPLQTTASPYGETSAANGTLRAKAKPSTRPEGAGRLLFVWRVAADASRGLIRNQSRRVSEVDRDLAPPRISFASLLSSGALTIHKRT